MQVGAQKARGASGGGHVQGIVHGEILAEAGFFRGQEFFPSPQDIFGSNAEAALDEKAESGLPGRTEVEHGAATHPVEVPKKLFEAVRDAVGLLHLRGARGSDSRYCTVVVVRLAIRGNRAGTFARHAATHTNAQFTEKAHKLIRRRARTAGNFRCSSFRRGFAGFHFAAQGGAFFDG